MRCLIRELKETGGEMAEFLCSHRLFVVLTGLLSCLAFCPLLINSGDILTDSETYITNLQDTLDTFMKVGRFGIVLTKKLFSTNAYVPVLFAAYTMIVMWISCLFFSFIVSQAAGDGKKRWEPFFYIFSGLYLTSPVFPNQFYFIYQAFEVSFAFLLCMAAAYCAFQAVYREKSPWWCLPAAGLMVWGFSTYQVLVPYYIAVNGALYIVAWLFGKKEPAKSYFVVCLQLAALFLAGLAAYLAASRLVLEMFFHLDGTTHLTDTYSCWTKLGADQCLDYVTGDLKRVLLHDIPVPAYNRFFGPVAAAAAVFSWAYGWKRKKKGYVLFVTAVVITISSVFLMTFLLGNYQIVRAQMVLPFVMAFCGALLSAFPYPKRAAAVSCICILMALLAGNQLKTSNRCYETMHLTAVEDERLAHEIYEETGKYRNPASPGDMPVVLIGARESVLPDSYVFSWDALGLSFFDIDHDNVHGSVRIARLMNCLGLETAEPSQEQYGYGVEAAKDMACWPLDGSVKCENGVIIVKLSEP